MACACFYACWSFVIEGSIVESRRLLKWFISKPLESFFIFLSTLNPYPSQLRYLQYISRRNFGIDWPPADTPLVLDCLMLRVMLVFEGGKGCRPTVSV
ncbi:Formin-like protein 20 [Linum perenne]